MSVHCELIEVCTRVNLSVLYITEDFLNLDHEWTRNLKRFKFLSIFKFPFMGARDAALHPHFLDLPAF